MIKFNIQDKNLDIIGNIQVLENTYKKYLSNWIRDIIGKQNTNESNIPLDSNGITIYNKKVPHMTNKFIKGGIGYISAVGLNDFYDSGNTFILSRVYWHNCGGIFITKKHFKDICTLFTIRRSIVSKWYNSTFPFFEPDPTNPIYPEFENDSVIYTLFHSNNHATSMSNLEYDNKKWSFRNNFFWITRHDFENIKDVPLPLYNDCNQERISSWASKWLLVNKHKLSKEALDLLNMGNELVYQTMKDRLNTDPKFQLNRYDAGFQQIRLGILEDDNLKLKYKPLYDELRAKRKILELKCRNNAEQLGCWWKVEMIEKNN